MNVSLNERSLICNAEKIPIMAEAQVKMLRGYFMFEVNRMVDGHLLLVLWLTFYSYWLRKYQFYDIRNVLFTCTYIRD